MNTGKLNRAQFWASESVGYTGDFTVSINTVDGSGVPTHTVLASTTVPDPQTAGAVSPEAVFASPADVVAGQQYALVISRAGSASLFTIVTGGCPGRLYVDAADPFNPGFMESAGTDLVFATFVTLRPAAAGAPSGLALTCEGNAVTIPGTTGKDEIAGTDGPDVIAALSGNDRVSGLGGKDLICGGAGKDTLNGGAAKDTLLGQGGSDTLKGGGAKDICKGGKGDDSAKCEVEKSI